MRRAGIFLAVAVPLALAQQAQSLTLMACWGPPGSDMDISRGCSHVADTVEACKAQAAAVAPEFAFEAFYACLEDAQ